MENGTSNTARDPSGFLSEIIGNAVTVKLNSGIVYKGTDSPLKKAISRVPLYLEFPFAQLSPTRQLRECPLPTSSSRSMRFLEQTLVTTSRDRVRLRLLFVLMLTLLYLRRAAVRGRLHEHRIGADKRACTRKGTAGVRRRIH